MRIAIVEDVPQEAVILKTILKRLSEDLRTSFDISIFSSGEEIINIFNKHNFEIVFMDIYMNGMTGVETAKSLRKQDRQCIIIFLTSSSEHMPDAFSCHAFEYIQKPFTTERIVQVMAEALETLPDKAQYIEIISSRQTVRVFLDEIVSAVTDAHYLDITLSGGENLHCRMTMTEFLKKTGADSRFISVNKGITVNAEHILEFENNCCIMENSSKFPVRVRESAVVEQMVMDYNFEKIRRRQSVIADRHHRKEK
ncbi:MAG: LytTR family DNA-binding domain-containing protein [Muribaculaceae bacterium]|nr:LytTR family DNA-binding domain-containing protein [Alistipes senegalensis]MCM1473701.1 LytTR family DNA-binding domain-containing protein [Muribaculaceae bacterium]